MSYYEQLPNIEVRFHEGKERLFTNCESQISGDFLIIFQDRIKTVLRFVEIDNWIVIPNESNG